MKIKWNKVFSGKEPPSPGKRGKVSSLSARSAQRLIFNLANAPRRWSVMATLTFRERVMDGREVLARFQRLLPRRYSTAAHSCWVREYQGRGAVHYHYMWSEEILTTNDGKANYREQSVRSGGKVRRLVRGECEREIVEAWMRAVGDTSPEFAAFQWGGIVQLWDGENGAAQYFGSYLAKAEQKTLPEDAETSGRWWWICPQARPVPVGEGFLTSYPWSAPLAVVFDKEPLMDLVAKDLPPYRDPKLLRWLQNKNHANP